MNDRKHRRKLGQNYLVDPVILFEIERAINCLLYTSDAADE